MESVENFLELGVDKLDLSSTYKAKPRLIYVIWHWTYKPYVYTWVIISSKKIDFQYKPAYMSISSICLIFFQIYDCNQIWHMATFAYVKEYFQKKPTLLRNNS